MTLSFINREIWGGVGIYNPNFQKLGQNVKRQQQHFSFLFF